MTTAPKCECKLAGYCERHKMQKHDMWFALCQKEAAYFDAWERGVGPGQKANRQSKTVIQHAKSNDPRFNDIARQLWADLHGYTQDGDWSPTEAHKWLRNWQRRIPRYGCSCKDHWRKITIQNPPDFSSEAAFRQWGIDRHNDVNKKLGKPIWSS